MSETELRWQLRQLPRELDTTQDLWPGIAARIAATPRRSTRARWLAGFAIAASLCLGIGLAWQLGLAGGSRGVGSSLAGGATVPAATPGQAAPQPQPQPLLQREAEALTLEYKAALSQFEGAPMPAKIEPALATLDLSAQQIRSALDQNPDAVYLLDQLRRTYARRLSLTQRAITS